MSPIRDTSGRSREPRRRMPGPDTARLSDMERAAWSDAMSLEDASRSREGLARYDPGVVSHLPGESILRIEVNGELAGAVHCLPDAPAELAVGWAYMHGFFTASDEIDAVTVEDNRVSLMVETSVDVGQQRRVAAGWSDIPEAGQDTGRDDATPFVIHRDILLNVVREAFTAMRKDRAGDGFVHAAVASDTGVHCVARDMTAGVAAAKIAGWLLRDGRRTGAPIFVVCGMVDRRIVATMSRLGVSLVATTGIPTADAFREATGRGISLIGLARSQRPGLLVDAGHILEGNGDA